MVQNNNLLGTDDIGAGRRWEFGIEHTREWFEYEEWAEEIGEPYDSSQYHLVIENDNGYGGTLYLFVGKAQRLATGAGVPLPNEQTYPDLYTYLRRELDAMVASADQAELGSHSTSSVRQPFLLSIVVGLKSSPITHPRSISGPGPTAAPVTCVCTVVMPPKSS